MKNILRFAAFLLIILIACRDREFLLGPDQGSGALLVSVRFVQDSLKFADIQNQSAEKSKRRKSGHGTAQTQIKIRPQEDRRLD